MERISLEDIKAAFFEARSVRKMHLLEGYDGESMEDLKQVKKDVYQNFSSIAKLLITYLCASGHYDKRQIMRIIGLSLTFKLILKQVHFGNRSYVDILTELESIHGYYSDFEFHYILHPDRHLCWKVTDVLSNITKRGFTYMIDEVESVLELARSNYFKVDDLPHNDTLLIKFLQFSKDYWLTNHNHENLPELFNCIEAVIDTIIKKLCNERWWCENNSRSHSENSYLCMAILEVLVLLLEPGISTPTLTHEILISYAHCIQLILKDEGIKYLMGPTEHDQLMIINGDVGLLVRIQHQENTTSSHLVLPIQPQAILWNIGSLIYSVLNNGNMATKRNLLQLLPDLIEQHCAILCNIGSLIYSVLNNGNMATKRNLLQLPDLIEQHCLTRQFLSSIIIKRLMQASPHTDPFSFMNFLTRELMNCNLDSIFVWKDHFQEIHKGLVFFSSFLEKTAPSSTTNGASQGLYMYIKNVAYMAEYLFDSFVVGALHVTERLAMISILTEEINLINASMLDSVSNTVPAINMENSDARSPTLVAEVTNPVRAVDVVVGFDKEIEVIMGQLISNSKDRDVVSITGMPGLGKTTLSRKVFDHPYIVNHFQCRAWCCVSKEYHKRELLLAILSCIDKLSSDEINKKSDVELCVMLHKALHGRRYLIVMDDIWVEYAFDELQLYFPENCNGSRLMLTSRYKSVGALAKYHLELGLLTEELSWDLLEQNVYPREKCPSELCQVGKETARKCNGLPLAVVVIGGILATSDKKFDFWKQVAGNLSVVLDPQLHVMSALDLSYNMLPDNLKPLFLYIGAFPEDENISVKTLKWLWVAEGFVHKGDGNMRLEDEAEIKLMELTNRNLLMVAERRYDGRVESVRIHDLLREMSIRKAEEEMFSHKIHVHYSVGDSLPDPFYSFYRASIYMSETYVSTYPSQEYTPIYSGVTYDDLQRHSMTSPLHSVLLFDSSQSSDQKSFHPDLFFHRCKLLRVLYFESVTFPNLRISDIIPLVRLRYISIKTSENKIPSSISSLINLETLIVKGGYNDISVPVEIWEMVKLRHIHITPLARFIGAAPENSSKLENLQTLSTAVVDDGEEKSFIKRIPNVRELKCRIMLHQDSNQYYLELESLHQLESLELSFRYYYDINYALQLSFPSTLKELTLQYLGLQWSQISDFQKNIPNLEFLKLGDEAVDGELWELGEDDVFPKLKVLIFEWLRIKEWIASAENFPCLQKLVIHSCRRLEEIPCGIGEIDSLLEIQLEKCRDSVENSAREIEEYQKDFGNESLIVRIFND